MIRNDKTMDKDLMRKGDEEGWKAGECFRIGFLAFTQGRSFAFIFIPLVCEKHR